MPGTYRTLQRSWRMWTGTCCSERTSFKKPCRNRADKEKGGRKMGYYVIMNEIEQVEEEIGKKTLEWMGQVNAMAERVAEYSGYLDAEGSGETVEGISRYLKEVHLYLLNRIYILLQEMFEKIVCYAEGYYEIEADIHDGEIAQESLEEQEEMLEAGRGAFLEEVQKLEMALSGISDIFPMPAPSTAAVEEGFAALSRRAEELRMEIGRYEEEHLSGDFETIEGMTGALRSFLDRYSGKGEVFIGSYRGGDILKYPETMLLMQLEEARNEGRKGQEEEIGRMTELFTSRVEAEQRMQEGKQKFVTGLLIAGGAVVTIVAVVASAGTATPVVSSAWGQAVVLGGASMSAAYGMSEAAEGINLYRLGMEGDTVTVAGNPIRDVIFQGNEEIYQLWGQGSVLVMDAGMTVAMAGNLLASGGVKALLLEGGKIVIADAAGKVTVEYLTEELDIDPTSAMLAGIAVTSAAYGGMNAIQRGLAGSGQIQSEVRGVDGTGDNKDTVTYRRVQGGTGNNASRIRIEVNADGTINIQNKKANLNISIDSGEHSDYYLNKRGGDAQIVEVEVPKWFDDFLQENAVPQVGYKTNSLNQRGTAPKITDIRTPGNCYELPAPWIEWLEEYGMNARIKNP
ncbi:MAG: LXG domain-containing protein [Blautia sp.]|nr:LXG domain-containing protein [Lachnoclostridium sp.]MCM1212674.1 LXG domain-containing protein [Blautia sp.]